MDRGLAAAMPLRTASLPPLFRSGPNLQIHHDQLLSSIVVTFRSTYGNSAGW